MRINRIRVVLGWIGLCWMALAQTPDCKPVTYWKVSGCQIFGKGTCPKGYHEKFACPPNPMMKAPCYRMCVADEAGKSEAPKKDHAKKQ